ncbi:MAG: acetate--CoA ligase family protein, partial [Pseudomonadota bacterium]
LGVAGLEAAPIPEKKARKLEEGGAIFSNGPLIDLTFKGTRSENVSTVLNALVEMPECDGVVMVVGSSAQFHPDLALKPFINLKGAKKPLGAFLVPDAPESNRLLTDAGIAGFRTPEGCADAFRCCLGWHPPISVPDDHASDLAAVDTAIADKPAGTLDEQQSRTVFEALGVPQAAAAVADDEPAAGDVAGAVGYPMVAKILSPDIAHKTEAGGVFLGIDDEAALSDALATIRNRVTSYRADARIEGFLLQKMESGLGEVLLGYRHDPLIGPTVVLGTGGILSEVYGDVAIRVAPVSAETAHDMINEVKGLAPLRGYRGLPEGDLDALAEAIVALSNLARLSHDRVREAEINPLLVRRKGDGVVAVDGLVVLE